MNKKTKCDGFHKVNPFKLIHSDSFFDMMLPCSLFVTSIVVVVLVSALVSEYIDCTDGSCTFGDVRCVKNNTCIIDCQSDNSCKNTTINCQNNQDCHIIVSNNDANCAHSSIINCPDNANCIMNGDERNGACENAIINCGIHGSCYFLFNQHSNSQNIDSANFHGFLSFNAINSKYIQIYKYGSGTNSTTTALYSSIYCPNKSESIVSCDIVCVGASDACDYLDIYSVNGFNGLKITIMGSESMSFIQTYLHCGVNNFSNHCSIDRDSKNPNQCVSQTNYTNVCDWKGRYNLFCLLFFCCCGDM